MTRPDPRLSAALAGAVDLSALAARAQQQRKAPTGAAPTGASPTDAAATGGGPAGTGPVGTGPVGSAANGAGGAADAVIDVTEANFQAEVLDRSLSTPVVIDFWADWCEPCKQLSPVLERLAAEGAGSWVLAKVDVDANQRLAQAFRIQSIPTVIAIAGGQPLDAVQGALPESQLRPWLDAVLAAASAAGVQGSAGTAAGSNGVAPAGPQVDPRLVEADDKMADGDVDAAEVLYRQVLDDVPGDELATSGLAQIGLYRRLGDVDPDSALAKADAAPDDVDLQTAAADVELATGRAEAAFARLVATVRRTSDEDRDRARTHLLGLFAIAAPDDPAVVKARRDLASALF